MLIDRLIRKLPCKSDLARTLIGSVIAAMTVFVGVMLTSNLLGLGTPTGVATALAAVSAAAYAVARR
jgi:hypothetical protein